MAWLTPEFFRIWDTLAAIITRLERLERNDTGSRLKELEARHVRLGKTNISVRLEKLEREIFNLKVQIYTLDSRTYHSPFSRIISPKQSDDSHLECRECGEPLIKLGLCGECWIKKVERIRTEHERPTAHSDNNFPFGKPVR